MNNKNIDLNDVNEKTPNLEQFLIEIAKGVGAKKAVLFDGTVINLVNKENTDNA